MKIAIVYNTDFYIWKLRRGLINALKEKSHNVYSICPDGNYVRLIESLGVVHIPIIVASKGINPLKDLKILLDLYKIFKMEKFDLIHTFTIKPNIYGAIAGRLAGIPAVVSSVAGLGYLFSEKEKSLKFWAINIIAKLPESISEKMLVFYLNKIRGRR